MATQQRPIRWIPTVLGVLVLVGAVMRLAAGVVVQPTAWSTVAAGGALLLVGMALLRVGRGAPIMPSRPDR